MPALVTQFTRGLGASEEDLKFVNLHTMREDAETSAWLTTADDNPYQQVSGCYSALFILDSLPVTVVHVTSGAKFCMTSGQALKEIEACAHRKLKGERARGLSISQDRF